MRSHTRIRRRSKVNKLYEDNYFMPFCAHPNTKRVLDPKKSNHECLAKRNTGFWRTIWAVIKGKKDTNGQYTVGTFAFFLYFLFKGIGGIGMLLCIPTIIADVIAVVLYVVQGIEDFRLLVYYIVVFFVLLLAFLYSVMIWGAANEIEKEKDKNYVLAVFSGVVSFAALVATLLQGVN